MHRNNYSLIKSDIVLKFMLVIFCHSTTIAKKNVLLWWHILVLAAFGMLFCKGVLAM